MTLIDQFMDVTQYSRTEVLAWNPTTKLFLTRNGGLYRMSEREVEHLKGPPPDPEERIDDDA